ncbi:MAG TPA: TOBE domain-containing protein, partial [Gemmatimonadaceae bacterium]|nr:TOBE domain-containing protein [Gemmatimonadaceae bacterium]
PATAVLRPDALGFSPPHGPDAWTGVVQERRFAGALLAYRVRVAGDVDLELHSTVRDVQPGETVWVRVTREPVAVVA